MSTSTVKQAITANNDGIIMADGYELALVKNGKIVASGQTVHARVFDEIGDRFIECFNKIVDIRARNTQQHQHTSAEGISIPATKINTTA